MIERGEHLSSTFEALHTRLIVRHLAVTPRERGHTVGETWHEQPIGHAVTGAGDHALAKASGQVEDSMRIWHKRTVAVQHDRICGTGSFHGTAEALQARKRGGNSERSLHELPTRKADGTRHGGTILSHEDLAF